MSEMEKFFNEFQLELQAYEKEEEERQKRGLHDYNIFTVLFRENDEVRLHSAFLYSLLNPNALHYQDELFLSKFIDTIGLSEFGLVCKEAKAYKEYKNIDIFITDDNKHIIIENKLDAPDQDCQIERYIDTIKDASKEANGCIYVLFLSPNKRELSRESKGKYEFCYDNTMLKHKNFKVYYKNITYKEDILKWLNECQKEIENLTDLSIFIKHYKNLICKITNPNQALERNKMCIETITKNYMLATKISENLVFARKEIIDKFIKDVESELYKIDEIKNGWIVQRDALKPNEKHKPLSMHKKALKSEYYFEFVLEVGIREFKNVYYCFTKNSKKICDCSKIDANTYAKRSRTEASIYWQDAKIDNKYLDADLAKEIEQGLTADKFAKSIFDFVKEHEQTIDEINNNIEKYLVV